MRGLSLVDILLAMLHLSIHHGDIISYFKEVNKTDVVVEGYTAWRL